MRDERGGDANVKAVVHALCHTCEAAASMRRPLHCLLACLCLCRLVFRAVSHARAATRAAAAQHRIEDRARDWSEHGTGQSTGLGSARDWAGGCPSAGSRLDGAHSGAHARLVLAALPSPDSLLNARQRATREGVT